ncbi:MAG: hypothetical protein Fur003_1830 [Candidatus Dojkabacteria bacterium]
MLALEPKKKQLILMVLAIFGLALSLYLWYSIVYDFAVVCNTGCDIVARSKYAHMLGVPVAAYGAAFYVGLFVLAFQRSLIKHPLLTQMYRALLLFGVVYTLYLRYLEFFKIGSICIWCWGSVLIVALLSVFEFATKSDKK